MQTKTFVPLLDLKAQHEPLRAELLEAVGRVLDSQHFILGPEVERLEAAIAAYSDASQAIGVSSGTDALLVALMALGVGPGDEVVTPAFSFFATAGVVSRLGARPVFVDIDPETFNLAPAHLERAISPRCKGVIPVHLFGQAAEMRAILEVAERKKIFVLEDAAQAIGTVASDGRRVGAIGTLGCLSFFPSKNLGAIGDAGMVVTNDLQLAEKIRVLRAHGAKPKYYHSMVGGNFRLDAVQAAVLNVKLPYLDGWTRRRQENAARYNTLLAEAGLVSGGSIKPPTAVNLEYGYSHHHIYNQYVVRATRRDELRVFLHKLGIATEIYYPMPFHLQECFTSLGYRKGDFPEAERAAVESLALPVYPEISPEMQRRVVEAIREFYSRK